MTEFAPIAIVGRSIVVPGALSPEALWESVSEGRDLVSSVPGSRWGIDAVDVLCDGPEDSKDRTWSDRGGYVRGFGDVFDPDGFALPAEQIRGLDPVFQWTFHTAREALRDAGYDKADSSRFGAVFGNLSFPSAGMAAFTQATTIAAAEGYGPEAVAEAGLATPSAANRFNSGLPALLLEQALKLGTGAFALDAACASSLYAIKLACDQLHDGASDLMLAGAVNCADDLCIHLGFSALQALSRTGQTRPFHKNADGLVPAEGCGFVALKRLEDAVAAGDTIHGIIRGVGLSNDGRSRGMLVPSAEGQTRAISQAFAVSGLQPTDVSLLECHATGTQVGDATEIESSAAVYGDHADLPIGSLKSNTGHLITAAGVAGLIKVIEAMRHEVRPPTLHADAPLDVIDESPFRVLTASEPWERSTTSDGVLRAGVSAFGFGGNNAHLLVEEPASAQALLSSTWSADVSRNSPIAIVGIGVSAASAVGRQAFDAALRHGVSCLDDAGEGRMGDLSVALKGLKFPPNDLKSTLGQQLVMLQVADEALLDSGPLPTESTGVYVGMGTDPEAARFGVRWRLATSAKEWGHSAEWVTSARDDVGPALDAAGVLGTMPNIVANRLNSQFDMAGPSFAVSAEESSGLEALGLASRALRAGEIDSAMVGAVDMSCNQTHISAAVQTLAADRQIAGDAAVMLVLKRLDDAEQAGDTVYAVLPGGRFDELGEQQDDRPDLVLGLGDDASTAINLTQQFGHAHAASGLVHVAAAALSLHHRTKPGGSPLLASNPETGTGLVIGAGPRTAAVSVSPMAGIKSRSVLLAEASDHDAPAIVSAPRLHLFSGKTAASVLEALAAGTEGLEAGPARLAIVASGDDEFERRATKARSHIESGTPPGQGVHYRSAPIDGEMGFVFTAAGAAYPGMGADLLRAMPELASPVSMTFPLRDVAGWVYELTASEDSGGGTVSPNDYLWGTSLLSQAHAQLTLLLLKLRPSAAIGYSSGESNSLYAFDVWSDMDAMRREIDASGMMDHELGVDFAAIARAWGTESAEWAVWNTLAPLDEVRAAVAEHDRVHVSIINTERDAVISGDPAQCNAVVERLGRRNCVAVDYNLACHVPEIGQTFRQPWLDIHTRDVTPMPGVRYYSNGTNAAYDVDPKSCAEAITAQASSTLDFTATIEAAYRDGVRIFVEHGPAGACTNFISEILRGRDVLCIQLDRRNQNLEQIFNAVGALIAAGVEVDHEALTSRLAVSDMSSAAPDRGPVLSFPSHPAPVRLPPRPTSDTSSVAKDEAVSSDDEIMQVQHMAPAPALPPVGLVLDLTVPGEPTVVSTPVPTLMTNHEQAVREQFTALSAMHETFVAQQAEIHTKFLALRAQTMRTLTADAGIPVVELAPIVDPVVVETPPAEPLAPLTEPVEQTPVLPISDVPADLEITEVDESLTITFNPTGPTWDKQQLKIHSSGKISELFGSMFEPQDGFDLQCRMPEPPLLLADRVTGLDAEIGVLGQGTMWTETDINAGDWYLNDGYMPAGFMIESGQADLMLISYMGIDLMNQGERVYRLLGCTLTYHGDLPSPGETLEYEIRINGHAKHGDIRLFFFEYDCIVNGERRLTVRDAQAGFFSYPELDDALGILWTPEQGRADLDSAARVDAVAIECTKQSFTSDELVAFSEGRLFDCFGPGYEWGETHTRSPKVQSGESLFINHISEYDPRGGPWGRGFMRCETTVSPDDWFFVGHFKNDPCMPGNFMVEACIQALSFYLAGAGFTTKKDGWRFQPLPDQPFDLKCRGEINPKTQHVTYEVHVEELWDGPTPSVICDVVGFVDGEAAFHAHRIGVELVPSWPLTTMPERYEGAVQPGQPGYVEVATGPDGFPFDWKAMISCAWGKPSDAFGSMYEVFDGTRQSPRLPGEPYHFITRVTHIEGDLDARKAGMKIVCEYDIPDDVWYFDENGSETMPHAVLLEAALQPCGWVASAVGSVTNLDDDLMFRNLDGTGTLLAELTRTSGVLTTHVEIKSISNAGGMIIESFDVACFLGETKVYTMDTVFGFFPPAAFDNQAGLPIGDVDRNQLEAPGGIEIDLTARPSKYCAKSVRLAEPMLLMVDRATHVPDAGQAGLGIIRGEKDVDVSEWFFKAHFFQDPVQPGSLGIEALLQLLQFFMLDTDMAHGLDGSHFEPIMLDVPMTWKYRGQVTPKNSLICSTMEITDRGTDDAGPYVIGTGSLWVDGLRIYEAKNMGMRIVADEPTGPSSRAGTAAIPDPTSAAVELIPGAELSQRLADYWNPILGTPDGWAGEDIVVGLINQYVNRIVVSNQNVLDRLHGKPAIYLANHQVQIESLIATNVIPALTGLPVTTMANAKHETRWIGQIIDVLESYPGFQAFEQIVYFNQDQPESMFDIVNRIKGEMADGTRSFFVHTDGTRSQSCREETTQVSSIFLDMAIELGVPIVPVCFTGGLPVAPIEGKAEFPVGHGRQDYWLGEPIEPEDLQALPLRERVNRVLDAINGLGVSSGEDQPLPHDDEFATRAASAQEASGVHEVFASIWQILSESESENVSEQTQMLRSAAKSGSWASDGTPLGDWLSRLATTLLGESGAAPVLSKEPVAIERVTTLTVNAESHPQLVDHAVNGTPVIPVVYVLEWFARAASSMAKEVGLELIELADLQVLKGIVVESFANGEDLNLLVTSKPRELTAGEMILDLSLADARSPRLHYRCSARLGAGDGAETEPLVDPQSIQAVSVETGVYGGVLFHGDQFQVLRSVAIGRDESGMSASLVGVYAREWPTEEWISDPAALDGVLQLALLWTERLHERRSLPTGIGLVRLMSAPSADGYRATLLAIESTATKVVCDVALHTRAGELVAELLGIETHLLQNG